MIVEFFLLGKDPRETCREIDIDRVDDFDSLKVKVASQFNIVVPGGIDFQDQAGHHLLDIEEVLDCGQPVGVLVDGHSIRAPVSYVATAHNRTFLTTSSYAVGAERVALCGSLL